MDFGKLIFGDALNDEELGMFGNINQGIISDDLFQDEQSDNANQNQNAVSNGSSTNFQRRNGDAENMNIDLDEMSQDDNDKDEESSPEHADDGDIKSDNGDFSVCSNDNEEDKSLSSILEDSKNNQDDISSQIAMSQSINQSIQEEQKSSSFKRPYSRGQQQEQQIQDSAQQGIDLQVLIKKRDEIIYRLTQLYTPKSVNQKKKMIEFNKDKMHHINYDENDIIRKNKRKIKEELKSTNLKTKIRHQIKYTDPTSLLDDVHYLYKSGVTSKQLDQQKEKGKYYNVPHIGRIIPKKEELGGQSQLLQWDKDNEWDILGKKDDKKEEKQHEKEALKIESLESQYEAICLKFRTNQFDLSITELSEGERAIIKSYLKKTASSIVQSKYPKLIINPLQKNIFTFTYHLNPNDFSYRNQKSAMQSDDQGFLEDDGLGHFEKSNIFGINTQVSDERMSFISDDRPGNNSNGDKTMKKEGQLEDHEIQEQYFDQKFKIISKQQPIKRRKYWGEPLDCKSIDQINLENYEFQKYQDQLYLERGCQEEKVFKLEKVQEPNKNQKGRNSQKQILNDNLLLSETLKDIKDYEFLKTQEAYFYEDSDKKLDINTMMRRVKFQLGQISEQEFYEQEALADQIEASNNQFMRQQLNQNKDSVKEKQVELQMRRERVCNDIVDNMDLHYDKRKRELHDSLMKQIQFHEKQNQQPSQTQQTVAYASAGHALLQASSGMDDGTNKRSLSKSNNNYQDDPWKNGLLTQPDEEMLDEINHHQKHAGVGGIEENHLKRVTKNELNHAKCILKLTFTKFDWSEKSLLNFHRVGIEESFNQLKQEIQMEMEEKRRKNNPKSATSIVLSGSGARISEYLPSSNSEYAEKINYVSMGISIASNELIEKRFKKIGIINAHEYFKDRYKLSLRDGKYCLFEHIDQHPLFVNNFGMASKLKRYVYSDHILPQSAFQRRPENSGTRHMGPYGAQVLKQKGDKIPLLGQLDTRQYKGLTVMENNMYYCPVFYQKAQKNDFLCVIHKNKKGKNEIIVRDIQDLYLMGQEEPKMEVYNPQSRQYQHFIKRRTQAYVIRFLQENNNEISFMELNKYFPYINDQILKKIIKEINVEVDRNQYCVLQQEYTDEQFKQLITPENICQYESAQFGEMVLKKVGITDITNADKISYATNKFCSEEVNTKKQQIARLIEEEVLSTPWNLSQNFIHNKQTRGMMMLEGIGDPSNGQGGYSYLKLPLKISQDSLNKAKINRMYLNPAIQNPKAVTGTDADLRKLSKGEIRNKLIEFGFKEKDIQSFTRWEMVAILREQSCLAVQQGEGGDMKKFARGVRFTSKKQREMYQKQVNDIFKKQMACLSKETSDFIADLSDNDSNTQLRSTKRISEQQQMNNNYSRNIVEVKADIPIQSIKDIPNYAVLIMASQPLSALQVTSSANQINGLNIGGNSGGASGIDLATGNIEPVAALEALKKKINEGGSYKCIILRKKIRQSNAEKGGGEVTRVIYCSDPRQIKGFNKRKHKHEVKTKRTKKTSLKEKMQLQKSNFEESKAVRSESSFSLFKQQNSSRNLQNSNINNNDGGGHKIKIRDTMFGIGDNQSDKMSDYQQPSNTGHTMVGNQMSFNMQSSQITIPLVSGGNNNPSKNRKSLSRFQSQQLQKPYDNMSASSSQINQNFENNDSNSNMVVDEWQGQQIQQSTTPQKISISTVGIQLPMQEMIQPNKNKQKEQPIKQQEKRVKQKSKFAYNEEDFETYKPTIQTSSIRRQGSPTTRLNKLIQNIIEKCLVLDKNKWFDHKVTNKEAPGYQTRIKNPIDLKAMRDKTIRNGGEYSSSAEFLSDIELLKSNALLFNGSAEVSRVSQEATIIYDFAVQKIKEVQDEFLNLDALVLENKDRFKKVLGL